MGDVSIETTLVNLPNKNIVCFSSQAGCPLRCGICASGNRKFTRNLTSSEIIEQCMLVLRLAKNREIPVLFAAMGVGDPILNPHIHAAIQELQRIGKVSIATTAINLLKAKNFFNKHQSTKVHLSLHAPYDTLRREILDMALPSISDTFEVMRGASNTFECNYTLLDGINDSEDCALLLAQLMAGNPWKLKFTQYNQIHFSTKGFKASTRDKRKLFLAVMSEYGIQHEFHESNGNDVGAACGQMMYSIVEGKEWREIGREGKQRK